MHVIVAWAVAISGVIVIIVTQVAMHMVCIHNELFGMGSATWDVVINYSVNSCLCFSMNMSMDQLLNFITWEGFILL